MEAITFRLLCRIVALFLLLTAESVYTQQRGTSLDRMLTINTKQFQQISEFGYNTLNRIVRTNIRDVAGQLIRQGKLQPRVPDTTPFPCDVSKGRSPERPVSVHALRPGDIDVIGAMGDSLTAAFGALATDVVSVVLANRGVSFAAGGDNTWRSTLTLPNILREFNPNLVGFSHGEVWSWQHSSQFNVAEAASISVDMPHQAWLLVKRIKLDNRVDFDNDWKLITIFVGCNDFCSFMCYENATDYYMQHTKHLLDALDVLHDSLPRVLINILPTPNLNRIFRAINNRPATCSLINMMECSCLYGARHTPREMNDYNAIMERWKFWDMAIDSNPRYRDRPDFAVVVQPFTADLEFPSKMTSSGRNVSDLSYLSHDCFHFSQKTHAISATALWNNMMEPEESKTTDWDPISMNRFLCPTDANPYIYTWANSNISRFATH